MAVEILVVQPDLNLGILKTLHLLQSDRYLVRIGNYFLFLFDRDIRTNPCYEVVMTFRIFVPDSHYQALLFDEAQIHL